MVGGCRLAFRSACQREVRRLDRKLDMLGGRHLWLMTKEGACELLVCLCPNQILTLSKAYFRWLMDLHVTGWIHRFFVTATTE